LLIWNKLRNKRSQPDKRDVYKLEKVMEDWKVKEMLDEMEK